MTASSELEKLEEITKAGSIFTLNSFRAVTRSQKPRNRGSDKFVATRRVKILDNIGGSFYLSDVIQ